MDYDLEKAKTSNNYDEIYTDNEYLKNIGYKIIRPKKTKNLIKCWGISIEKIVEKNIKIEKNNDEYTVYQYEKVDIDEKNIIRKKNKLYYKLKKSIPLKSIVQFSSNSGEKELSELLNSKKIFDNPKPVELIKSLLRSSINNNDIILDFFSGSATTAHAVMKLNAEDGGNRKFIMVQLREETDEKSEAYKAGYKNICEIGKERIRRAGEKIVQETGKKDLDIGFRVLKVDESNMQDVYYRPIETKQDNLFDRIENIKPDRTALDLLFGVMVEWGVELSLSLKEIKNNANTIYVVGDSDLVACFDKEVDDDTITKMAELMPTRVIFRDSCFDVDDKKINMFEIFKTICNWDDKQAMDNVRVI